MNNAVIITGPGFQDHDVVYTYYRLKEEGYNVDIATKDGKAVVGIFSERDIVYGVARHGSAFLRKTVADTMTAPAITVAPDTAILSALSLMTKRRIRHLPVIQGDDLVGFVSIGDLVKHRIDKIEAEAAAMRDYISMA